MKPTSLAFASALTVLAATSAAHAAPNDGVYGRLDGDLGLSLGAGVGVAKGGALAALLGRAIFLDSVGMYASYVDALDAERSLSRSFSVGVELRPLFLARWANGLETGPATLDLAIDSLALDIGAFWSSPARSSSPSTPGLEIASGFEVPLLGRASGPWVGIRGALRWKASDFAGTGGNASERGAIAMLTFSWQGRVTSRIADAGDIRPQ